jgi:hypothetical protein
VVVEVFGIVTDKLVIMEEVRCSYSYVVATANYSGTTSGSPTVTTDGTDTVLVFNASGSYTG